MGQKTWDFSGWATRFDRLCSDGRTIRDGAFDDDDGLEVPLVWQHNHNSPDMVLGHALLEKRPGEGMYAYCSFNNTDLAQAAKENVRHGDITSLSIHANKLKQSNRGDVLHGRIREVSLVMTGANPDAKIDVPVILHSDDMDDSDEAIIFSGEDLVDIGLEHEDKEESEVADEKSSAKDGDRTIGDVFETLNEEQKKMVYAMLAMASADKGGEVSHADDSSDGGETIGDVFNTLNDKQKDMVYALLALATEGGDTKEKLSHMDMDDDYYEGGNDMRRNVFEEQDSARPTYELTHSDFEAIVKGAGSFGGSLRDSFRSFVDDKLDKLSHSADVVIGDGEATYGVADIDWLFPEPKLLNNPPDWIKRDTDWVTQVMSTVKHSPFSRIKSQFADITADAARAKGYTKGHKKVEEVFSLMKRTTAPTTVYKKQKLDRDDRIDITDFDIVAWLKSEMRLMLDEELARAFLVGDGRDPVTQADDKINEDNIRPVWTDDELFTIHYTMEEAADVDEDTLANDLIRASIKARKDYKGSGSPVMYIPESKIIDMLLLEDGIGNRKYKTREELATACGVSRIVPVPVMEGLSRTVTVEGQEQTNELVCIIVNMADYNVGADKGGAVSMFEDFDIDYNQEKYLIETRCSGALVKPKSAIAIELHKASV